MIRLFIAVPVPGDIKKSVAELLGNVKPAFKHTSDIRFVSQENWHFTVTFLGYQEEVMVPMVEKSLEESISIFRKKIKEGGGLHVEFNKLIYGPPGKTPRMIWLTTTKKTSEELGAFKGLLEDTLEKNGVRWRRESRPLQAHITLARFLPTAKKKLPSIDRNLFWKYGVGEFNLMKSTLRRGGAVYEMLSSVEVGSPKH